MIIAHKELRALYVALQRWQAELYDRDVLVWEDNMNVVSMLAKGSSRSPTLMRELREVWAFMLANKMRLQVRYIASEDNIADSWSRWRDRSAWTLVPEVLQPLRRRVAPTLDPFACSRTAVVPRFCSRHVEPGAEAIDGFSVSWVGETVWLNPPWQLLPRVLAKIAEDGCRGVLILPLWRSQTWFPTALSLPASWYLLPPPRLSVLSLHSGQTEPFTNHAVQLCALLFDMAAGRTSSRPGRGYAARMPWRAWTGTFLERRRQLRY